MVMVYTSLYRFTETKAWKAWCIVTTFNECSFLKVTHLFLLFGGVLIPHCYLYVCLLVYFRYQLVFFATLGFLLGL